MLYTDYRDAAERHLEVCLQLQSILESYQTKESSAIPLSISEQKEKTQILSDLYYLSGYIIECSYSCAICKSINWTTAVDLIMPTTNSYGISFRNRNGTTFSMTKPKHQLSTSGHMEFFQTIIPITPAYAIPLVIDAIAPTRLCYDLFDNWNAEIRYLVDSSLVLDYDNVFDFFYLSVEVYEGLLRNAMI